MKYSLLLVLLAALGSWASMTRYDNYRVYRLIPRNYKEVAQLKSLERNGTDLDFWIRPAAINKSVDIMVSPGTLEYLLEFINESQIENKLIIDNVQRLIEDNIANKRINKIFNWNKYHRLADIYAWMEQLSRIYSEVTLLNIGKSYEGRDLLGVKVSFRAGNKGVFLEGGIHAREWIVPSTVTYILSNILNSKDPTVRDIAESYDWYIFPVTNPDGYEYTHTTNRSWRKTRQPYSEFCIGVDANRNWGFHWMEVGASSWPCEDTFAGFSPFSESETKALSKYITSIHKSLVGYISFHSYSQYLLIPYGHTNTHLDNYNELMIIGEKAVQSLARRYGTNYTVGTIVDIIYPASGNSMDWVKHNYHIPITYTFELRDTGIHGFLLPPEQIIPTGQETLDALITIMQESRARGHS